MRVRSVLLCAVAVTMLASSALAAPRFTDVPATHWAYDAIARAVEAGILQGYDGKFEGNRLLDRYQMASVVGKLLDARAAGKPAGMSADQWTKGLKDLEALTVEFGDELATMKIKVATLESGLADLRHAAMEAAPVASGNSGFTAFAAVALVDGDKDWGTVAPPRGAATDAIGAPDGMSFDVPQVSLGLDREISSGTVFHAQFDFDAQINGGSGGVSVNEAYVLFDDLVAGLDGKVGAFALPFSKEHTGPFRTCDLTISASVLSSYVEAIRGYGVEIGDTLAGRLEGLKWTFGVVSGTDEISPAGLVPFALSAMQPAVNTSGEGDDGFGWYVQVADGVRKDRPFGWYVGYFDNGGDDNAPAWTPETDFVVAGVDYAEGDVRVLVGYLDGSSKSTVDISQTTWYVLLNVALTDRNSATVRFDDWELGSGGPDHSGQALTFAFNRKISANQMLQFEWVSPDLDTAAGIADPKDDLIQIRYKVNF